MKNLKKILPVLVCATLTASMAEAGKTKFNLWNDAMIGEYGVKGRQFRQEAVEQAAIVMAIRDYLFKMGDLSPVEISMLEDLGYREMQGLDIKAKILDQDQYHARVIVSISERGAKVICRNLGLSQKLVPKLARTKLVTLHN